MPEETIELTERTTDELVADLVEANKKISELEAELEIANQKAEALASEKSSLETEIKIVLEPKKKTAGNENEELVFDYEGEKYLLLARALRIPGLGKMTALEIMTSDAAKKWLVEKQSGTIRKKV